MSAKFGAVNWAFLGVSLSLFSGCLGKFASSPGQDASRQQCGDGVCQPSEDCNVCPGDCGSCSMPDGAVTNTFACPAGSTPDIGASQLTRLSNTQYVNTLTDLFGSDVVSQLGSQLGVLPTDNTISNPVALFSVSSDHVTAYMNIALAAAQAVTSSSTLASTVFGSCAVAASPGASCVDTYLNDFARQLFRRPLTPAEITAGEQMVIATSGTYLQKLGVLLAYHLQSPWFINRIEVGTGTPDSATTFTLTPYEVASRIAYASTDSTPDTTLLQAAAANELSTEAQIEAHVRRLFATSRGKAKVRSLVYNYIGNPNSADLTVLPAQLLTGLQNPSNLSTAMFAELNQFIDYIVWEKNGSLTDLLTSKASFASDPDLASIYGNPPADPNRTPGSAIATFAGRRAGIMMRLPLLAGAKPRTSVPHRGVNYLRNILCTTISDPSPETMAMLATLTPAPDVLETMTTRTYLQTVTTGGACAGCHSAINPVGFSFENFDPVGRIRSLEAIFTTNNSSGTFVQNLPIDSSSDLTIGGTDFKLADALDLVTDSASSQTGIACFSLQAYRFLAQRSETTNDNCTLNGVFSQLTKSSASILDAMVSAIANSAATLHRKPM